MLQKITDLSFLKEAIDLYGGFWERNWSGHENKQECLFDGSKQDLNMLAYCEYELGFPEEDYDNAALIWANVIYANSYLEWGCDQDRNIYLYHEENGDYTFAINVKSYVFGFMVSNVSQFDNFHFLTEKILIEMMLSNQHTINEYDELIKIIQEFGEYSYSESLIEAIGDIYKPSSKKCKELSKLLLKQ